MRPQDPLDSVAFLFLVVGAFAWGYYFLTGINLIDTVMLPISDVLAAIVYILILLSGVYALLRATVVRTPPTSGRRWRRRRR